MGWVQGIAVAFHRFCLVAAIFWLLAALIHAFQAASELGWSTAVIFAQFGLLPAVLAMVLGRVVLFAFKRQ
jgi:hypothetical protein